MRHTTSPLCLVDWDADDVPATDHGNDPAFDALAESDDTPEVSALLTVIANYSAQMERVTEIGDARRIARTRDRLHGLLCALDMVAGARYVVQADSAEYLTVHRVRDRWTGYTVDSFTGGVSASARAERLAAEQNRANVADLRKRATA